LKAVELLVDVLYEDKVGYQLREKHSLIVSGHSMPRPERLPEFFHLRVELQ
jgi:hypothetical protein